MLTILLGKQSENKTKATPAKAQGSQTSAGVLVAVGGDCGEGEWAERADFFAIRVGAFSNWGQSKAKSYVPVCSAKQAARHFFSKFNSDSHRGLL